MVPKQRKLLLLLSVPHQNLMGRPYCLTTPRSWVMGLGENKLVQTWMLIPCWLAFMAPDGAIQGAEREEPSTILAALTLWDIVMMGLTGLPMGSDCAQQWYKCGGNNQLIVQLDIRHVAKGEDPPLYRRISDTVTLPKTPWLGNT